MKNNLIPCIKGTKWIFRIAMLFAVLPVWQITKAQEAIKLGAGTYAAYPPTHEAAKPYYTGTDAWGDLSQKMTHMKLYVVDTNTRAVPSTDWWTTLVSTRYSHNLWAYPGMVNAEDFGLMIDFPKYWNHEGRELYSKSRLVAGAEDFTAEDASARRWGAWTIDWIMNDQDDKTKQMAVTIGHGLPFTWIEYTKLNPVITVDTAGIAATYFNSSGGAINFPFTGDHLGIQVKGDHYGLFCPPNTVFSLSGNKIHVKFPSTSGYVIVATMPALNNLATFYNYAYAIPRDSKITWNYRPDAGKIDIDFELVTQNLKGAANLDLIQGWIPHHYKKTTRNFGFNPFEYQTPRGKMQCSTGRNFKITYDFNGLLPAYPEPEVVGSFKNPYRPDVMTEIINNYTPKSGYGTETYWGGKDILNYAKYMQLAAQTGNTQAFDIFKKKLTDALVNWYTYTPGENYHYFSWYPNWGSFMGYNTRDNENPGIDILQDHAFCYAYHIYAAAILFMYDKEFMDKYKDFTKMMVLDYANWNRNYKKLPWFRSMDPWCGHSFSGGMGDFNGNGQESSSEAMQAWGAMFLLGTVTNDTEMRDAAIFGYVQEAQAVAEYWFDRDHIPANGGSGNYDYTKFTCRNQDTPQFLGKPFPYNSNLVTQGIGWWTYFSGDWYWMHAIQWLPMSPFFKYMYEDLEFARWDYNSMWTTKSLGGWDSNLGNEAGVGNVALSYLQVSDPDSAAAIFDWLWDNNRVTARAPDNNAFTYWYTHAHRTLGNIQWNQHTNIATSTVYFNPKLNRTTVVVYNPEFTDQVCRVYNNGAQYASFTVPPRTMLAHQLNGSLTKIDLSAPAKTVAPGNTMQLSARCFDQYGAVLTPSISWSVTGGGSISSSGVFTAGTSNSTSVITARNGSVSASFTIRVNAAPVLTNIQVTPAIARCEIGKTYTFKASGTDQYGDAFAISPAWTVTGGGTINASGEFTPVSPASSVVVTATAGGRTGSLTLDVSYPLCNIALAKPVTASSETPADNIQSKINDGNESTRWESARSDNEWIRIDLQNTFEIEKVVIIWEAAFSKIYDIQVSSDDINYTTIYAQTNGVGGTEEFVCTGTGRYIRLLIKKRGTEWGNSVYEFEVYGSPVKSGSAVLSTIVVDPAIAIMNDNTTFQFTCKGFDQYGNNMATSPVWSVIGRGAINQSGLYTPNGGGMYLEPSFTVVATMNGLTSKAIVVVNETPKLMKLDILPLSQASKRITIPQGAIYSFGYVSEDQFANPFTGTLNWSTTGGSVSASGVYTATQLGDFMIFAQNGTTRDTAFVSVKPFSEVNIALFKPTKVSSFAGDGSKGDKAVDNDLTGTRWESIQGDDNQWISINLKARYDLSRVVLNWETASAKSYTIDISDDGINWRTVYSTTNGNGGREEININGQGQYIRMNATQRNTGYGYSIWEFEVYAKSMLSTLSRIEVTPADRTIDRNEKVNYTATGYDQNNALVPISPIWSASGGTIDANGVYTGTTAGSYTVSATANNITGLTRVTVVDTPIDSNIALNKPATASSGEGGYPAINVNDGNTSTRWSSLFADPQWVQIDLLAVYNINKVVLRWETAAAKAYRIEVSTDDQNWVSVYSTTTASGGIETHTVNGTGRYIRMYGTARTTGWGYSLWEFEVYGLQGGNIPPVANAGADKSIILPLNSVTIAGSGTDSDGTIASYLWVQVSGPNTANLSEQATPTLIASNLVQGTYQFRLTVTDNQGATASDEVNVTVNPPISDNIALNKPSFASSVSGANTASAGNDGNTQNTRWESIHGTDPQWYSVDLQGEYQINSVVIRWETAAARAYRIEISNDNQNWTSIYSTTTAAGGTETINVSGTGSYIRIYGTARTTGWGYSFWEFEVYGSPAVIENIALNKPSSASSVLGGNNAAAANDGNSQGSRWESIHGSDPQWYAVDLQNTYSVNRLVIRWETAAARAYRIEVSNDNVNWTSLYSTTTATGGTETLNVSGSGRYIRMYGTARTTGWGYSMWEFEVYGTETSAKATEELNPTEKPDDATVEIFPNPVSEILTIAIGKKTAFEQLSVFDISGRLVLQQSLVAGDESIDVNVTALKNGLYVIKLTGEQTQTFRVIKQ
ncbi:MAG: discoidin domain-containing protein [Bacteroidales bacterium]|nr:discoidin domain-containing protein [Bacteroidales bacterium]